MTSHMDTAAPRFDPAKYWSDLVRGTPALDQVGNVGCGTAFNRWIYRRKAEALFGALEGNDIKLDGRSIFEAGFGIGYYLQRWAERGVRHVEGVDLSSDAVDRATQAFPTYDLQRADLSELPPATRTHDLVLAIDVLYHITDDERWLAAVHALMDRVGQGGFLIFTDQFWSRKETRTPHVRRRTLADYQILLSSHGFGTLERRLFTRVLGHDDLELSWAFVIWRICHGGVRMAVKAQVGEQVGDVLGRALYSLENRYPGRPGRDQCLEIGIAQKVGDSC